VSIGQIWKPVAKTGQPPATFQGQPENQPEPTTPVVKV
jgi:hypothetical protein